MAGFLWKYGVVQQATGGAGGGPPPSPTAGISAINLGSTYTTGPTGGSFNTGQVQPVPAGAPLGSAEHTIQINTSFAGNGGTINTVQLSAAIPIHGNMQMQQALHSLVTSSFGDADCWMDNPDVSSIGGAATDAVLVGGGTSSINGIDVVSSNSIAGVANTFYFNFYETASVVGGNSAYGGGNLVTGDVVTFTLTVVNQSGTSATATTSVTLL